LAGCSQFDKPLGLMIRRWCAPVLGLAPHAEPDAYVAARRALGPAEVIRRLVGGNNVALMLVDTGHRSGDITDPATLTARSGVATREIVRIEALMEEVARGQPANGAALRRGFDDRLVARTKDAVGLKSIVAYRTSFDIDQMRPSAEEVDAAGDRWLRALAGGSTLRLEDPTLIRHALWQAGALCRERKFPLQIHVGFGDRDILMAKCDPSMFAPFIGRMEEWDVPIMLLHCYPFAREAGWLAEVFSNVYVDVGAIQNYAGPSARRILADAMELTPFYKQVYSSDAFGLPELHFLGARVFRETLAGILEDWIARGDLTAREAEAIATKISWGNARRIYPIDAAH
jgi:predicted TIM-barrel fold metal-dependent hydrolase